MKHKGHGQVKPNNLSKYRDEIISFSGISIKKKGKPKKNAKIDPLSKLSRKEKRKLERKLKHAKNLAFHKKDEMPKLESLIERKKKGQTRTDLSKKISKKSEEEEKISKAEKIERQKILREEAEKVKIKILNKKISNFSNHCFIFV